MAFVHPVLLQTSSNYPVFQGDFALLVTNVVNPSPKSAFSGVLARRLTTFVTYGHGDALKMLQIDDVCNNIREREPFEGSCEFRVGHVEEPNAGCFGALADGVSSRRCECQLLGRTVGGTGGSRSLIASRSGVCSG